MAKTELKMLKINKIEPNPFQPRETFEHEPLKELADSISDIGVLQPILVRPKGKKYQIIAGERRWKACLNANEKQIPALIRDMSDGELQIASLIENIHREDLSPIERAKALKELAKTMKLIDKKDTLQVPAKQIVNNLSKKVKISSWRVHDLMDLLDLPEYIQKEIKSPGAGTKESVITVGKAIKIGKIKDEKTRKKVFEKVKKEDIPEKEVRKLVDIVEKAPAPIRNEVLKSKPKVSYRTASKILELEDKEAEKVVFEETKKYDYSDREVEARVEDIKLSKKMGIEKPVIQPPKVYDPNRDFVDNFQRDVEKILVINPKRFAKLTKVQKHKIVKMIDGIEERCARIREIIA